MAVSIIPKRSTRLSSRNPSIRNTSIRKLRPRKHPTVDDNSQKINAGVRSKQVHVVESTSTKKHVLNKKNKTGSHTETNKLTKSKKFNKDREKEKTNKKEAHIISNTLNKNEHKRRLKRGEADNSLKVSRQMSLKESFSRQMLSMRLRPRQNKNYCDKLKHEQQHPLTNNVIVLEKLDLRNKERTPVYNTLKISEESATNKNDVYDFKFDANDTKEKLIKKKRKRKAKGKMKSKIIKKVVQQEAFIQSIAIDNAVSKSSDPDIKSPVELAQNDLLSVPAISPIVTRSAKNNICEQMEELINTNNQIVERTTTIDTIPVKQINEHEAIEPRIISIENADNIIINKSLPNNSEDPQFFHLNVFNNKPIVQYKNAVNCSVLTKALSPILKTLDTFDAGSPWRPPALTMFSQAKYFVQSTPIVIKSDASHKKHTMYAKSGSYNGNSIINISDAKPKNLNSSVQNISDKTSHVKKNSYSHRKFGIEITNMEHLNSASTDHGNNKEVIHEQPIMEVEVNPVPDTHVDTVTSKSSDYSAFDDPIDKENMAPNHQTPKIPIKKRVRKQHSPRSPSLFKISGTKSNIQTENIYSQPGPSGIKNLNVSNERKISWQSNLNNFLNVMDMPENTTIITKHGIFDDTRSMSINNNATKKTVKSIANLENAFGFCEKESELESEAPIDLIQTNIQPACINKPVAQPALTRLSLGEIQNNLVQKKADNHINKKQITDQNNIEIVKPSVVQNNKNVDILSFSDTFDVLSESEKLSNCETEIPLFMDLEPSHFSKPPRHSYKRKRAVTFALSEDSSEEEETIKVKNTKKKRVTKLQKENKKRLDDWIQNINDTFQEIDEYDLLIE